MFPVPTAKELRSYITATPATRRADRITPPILMYMRNGIMYIRTPIPRAGIIFNLVTRAEVVMEEGMADTTVGITVVTEMDIHSA